MTSATGRTALGADDTATLVPTPVIAAPRTLPLPRVLAPATVAARVRTPGPSILAWSAAAVLFGMYATLSLQRNVQLLTTGYDLGIFEQEVRSYATGQLPTSLLKGIGYPLLGDHFSPIVATIAPFYAMFPHPQTLLVAQALLIAVGAVPLVRWAAGRHGLWAGASVAAVFGLAGGVAHAIGFDFHEIAFAVPLLAFSMAALGQGRHRAAIAWALPLLLVKEDLGLTLAAIGALVAWRVRRSALDLMPSPQRSEATRTLLLGLGAAALGIAGTAVEMLVIIPSFNPDGANAYTGQLSIGGIVGAFTGPNAGDANTMKLATIASLLLPTAFLAVRSPLLLVAVPTLAWRFLSDNPSYWGTSFHYDAVLVPIATAAFIESLQRSGRVGRRRSLAAAAACALIAGAIGPLAALARPQLWAPDPHVAAARAVLAEIPAGSTVETTNTLAPQLTSIDQVSMLGVIPVETARPEYIAADTVATNTYPLAQGGALAQLVHAEGLGYRVIDSRDGVVLLRAPTSP